MNQSVAANLNSNSPNWSETVLRRSGQVLLVIGFAHLGVFVASGTDWEGSVSWRKPILFGVSTGMTLWSLGWIAGSLKRIKADQAVASIVSATLVIEVLLITLQQWRGTSSHFNQSTAFDATVDLTMLALITIAVVGICYFGIRCFGQSKLPIDYRNAARIGVGFLIVSCVIGFAISAHGYWQVEQGLPPETVGKKGVAKFPHGFAIHALQLLPALMLGLRKTGADMSTRLLILWAASASTSFLLAFSILQTIFGHARFDIQSPASFALLCLGLSAFLIPLGFAAIRYVWVSAKR